MRSTPVACRRCLAAIAILLLSGRTAHAVDSPAPNWLFRTHMNVETSAESPAENETRTMLNLNFPPDTQGAVSNTQAVTAANGIVRVFDRGRRLLFQSWMWSWWASHRANDSLAYERFYFDPRVQFDPLSQRWYSYATSYTDRDYKTDSMSHLAVSLTDDFLGEWKVWDVKTSDLGSNFGTKWLDQPRMGFGAGMVVVSVTLHQRPAPSGTPAAGTTDSPEGTVLIVLSGLANQPGGLQGTLTLFDSNVFPNSNSGVPFPATTLTGTSVLYLVSVHDYDTGIYALSSLRVIGGTVVLDKHFATVDAIGGFTILDPPAASNGGQAPQLNSGSKLETGAAIIESAVYRNGSLWFTQCVYGKKAAADTPSTYAHWMRLGVTPQSPAPTVLGEGLIGSPATWILYPSLCVNKNNDALIGYSLSGSSIYPSAGYSFRYGTDSANTLRDGRTYAAGLSTHYATGGGSRNRWGDYSATVIDPSDDLAMMTLQEYAETNSPTPPPESQFDSYPDRYGLMWARVGGTAVPEITTQPVDRVVVANGSTTFTYGAGSAVGATWQWFLNGSAYSALLSSATLNLTGIDATLLGKWQCKITSSTGVILWSRVANLKFNTGNPGTFSLSNFGSGGDGFYDAVEEPVIPLLTPKIYVTRSGGFDGSVIVRVRFRDPNASSAQRAHDGWDFSGGDVLLKFVEGGPTTQSVVIPILDDTLVESDAERFTVEIAIADSSGAGIGSYYDATILINDNDTAPSLATALDYAGVFWSSTSWKGQTTSSTDRTDAAQTDWADPGTDNDLAATFTGPATVLFHWRMKPVSLGSRLIAGDSLKVLVDGVVQQSYDASNGTPWVSQAATIPSGAHSVIWRFHRGTSPENETVKATCFLDKVAYYSGTAGVIEFSDTDLTVNEAAGIASLPVKRWGATLAGQFNIVLTPQSGTAADYTAPASPFTLAADATGLNAPVSLTNDTAAESTETFLATLTLPVGSPLKIGPAATLTVHLTDDDTGTYAAWRLANFTAAEAANNAISGPTANPDGDDLPNLLEWAFGGLPKSASPTPLPTVGLRNFGGLSYTTLTFRRPESIKGVSYLVQRSTDCLSWQDASSYGPTSDIPLTPITNELSRDGSPVELITVQDNTPLQNAPRAFLRVKVSLP